MPPRPHPTSSLQSWRSKTPNRVHEVLAPATVPDAPSFIAGSPELLACWNDVCEKLATLGVLSHVDEGVIARYVAMLERHRRASAYLVRHGSTYEIRDGNGNLRQIKAHPMVAEANSMASACLKLERELGLTPAARVALPTNATKPLPTEDDEIDDLILGISK
ncbi:MAG: phage terminase small subunit P27 family [Planctomycetia bacterium]